jgi:hypothetical protein
MARFSNKSIFHKILFSSLLCVHGVVLAVDTTEMIDFTRLENEEARSQRKWSRNSNSPSLAAAKFVGIALSPTLSSN